MAGTRPSRSNLTDASRVSIASSFTALSAAAHPSDRRGRLFIDAAQQPPIAEQVARPDFADRKGADAQKFVERKIGVKTDVPGQMRETPLHEAQCPVLAGEMVNQYDRSAGNADAPHLGREAG